VKILFFQNWSMLGVPLAEGLLRVARDELVLVGSNLPRFMRDRNLIREARRCNVPLLVPEDLLEPRFFETLQAFAPDLLVVATYPHKIPKPLLDLPRLAAVNLHPAYLPGYRGACPEFWVIRNGEAETGLTLHRMTERFDAGAILSQTRIPIRSDDTMLSLTERMIQPAWDLLAELLERYRRGERPEGRPQDPALVSRAPFVRPEHLQVNWTEPAEGLERLVRAAFPAYDVATRFRSLELLLRRVRPARDLQALADPGELLVHAPSRRLLAGTGRGLLELEEVQATYATSMTGRRFCETYGIRSGERLGTGVSPAASAPSA
jgi:UDP-4-amino-4-deoxy-L-arabinose formyltransferase/UDP-glucuronic acid dehydrogenase (UDP-4-keto-hexauronic acid decarboxylating)